MGFYGRICRFAPAMFCSGRREENCSLDALVFTPDDHGMPTGCVGFVQGAGPQEVRGAGCLDENLMEPDGGMRSKRLTEKIWGIYQND